MNRVSYEHRNSIDQPAAGEISVPPPPASEPVEVAPEEERAGSSRVPEPTAEPAGDAPVENASGEDALSTETPSTEKAVDESVAVGDDADDVAEEVDVQIDEDDTSTGMIEETPDEDDAEQNRDWYILKVQSNREDSIRDGLMRRVNIAGLERYFGDAIVPIEMVTEFKGGKKRVVKRKLYPGYIVVNMVINDETWFLVRETPGIGDFTGSGGKPTPMLPQEVARIVQKAEEKTDDAPKLKIAFSVGDRVKINEGTFESFDGEVDSIDEANGRVTVMINIFGRSTPVELEYWQIEAV